jgi:oxygen-dependent protoporphyrinogen oxidase
LERIAVIGGGISGLTSAWALRQRLPAAEICVWESAPRCGGVLQTAERDGLTLELGPDSMLRRLPWGVGLCRSLGLECELIGTEAAARGVYTVYRGRLVRMPEGLEMMAPRRLWPMATTTLLSWRGKLRMAAERLARRRTTERDESLADFARRRFGVEALERIIQPLAGGIYMGDPERLGMQAAFPQLVAAEREHGSLIAWSRRAGRQANLAREAGETTFVAPRRGFGQLVEALHSQLPVGTVRVGATVERLQPADSGWLLQGGYAGGGTFSERFDAVVAAAPAPQTATLAAEFDAELARLLSGIRYESCVVVHLAFAEAAVPRPLDAAGIVVPHVEGRAVNACTFSSVKYRDRAPQGVALLRAFLGGALQPHRIDQSDDELTALVRDELRALLGIVAEPLLVDVARWRQVMPQYGVEHASLVARIRERAAQHANLELAGNAYEGVGIPHCVRGAEAAAARLAAQGAAQKVEVS